MSKTNKWPTQAELYDQGWKETRQKAQQLANAYGKAVQVYRAIVNNRPREFKLAVEGDKRPAGVFLETIEPNPEPERE